MKIAFISTFFTGATLPLMKHLADKGHTTDLFLLCKQGLKGLETLPFDEPVFGNRISQIRQENQIYNYLNFERSKIYLTPYFIVRNRKYLVGFIPYFKNKLIIHQMMLIYAPFLLQTSIFLQVKTMFICFAVSLEQIC